MQRGCRSDLKMMACNDFISCEVKGAGKETDETERLRKWFSNDQIGIV